MRLLFSVFICLFYFTVSSQQTYVPGPHTLELFDVSGRIVKTITKISNEITIDDISTSRGIYWLVIKKSIKFKTY
jgi:hypothetical protein